MPPPTHYLRDLGPDVKALAIVNAERAERGLTPLPRARYLPRGRTSSRRPLPNSCCSNGTPLHMSSQYIARPLRVVATCVDKEPWQLTADDLRMAIRIGEAIQASGKLGDLVVGIDQGDT